MIQFDQSQWELVEWDIRSASSLQTPNWSWSCDFPSCCFIGSVKLSRFSLFPQTWWTGLRCNKLYWYLVLFYCILIPNVCFWCTEKQTVCMNIICSNSRNNSVQFPECSSVQHYHYNKIIIIILNQSLKNRKKQKENQHENNQIQINKFN